MSYSSEMWHKYNYFLLGYAWRQDNEPQCLFLYVWKFAICFFKFLRISKIIANFVINDVVELLLLN